MELNDEFISISPLVTQLSLNISPHKFTGKKAIEASLSRHLWPILGNFIAFPSQLGSLEYYSALSAV